ncbi:MAG: hypothetical protein J7639_05165 [Paenibacillaceae bacterium]|nr:hypothetical protein [Paenibacillaceae bacterium]
MRQVTVSVLLLLVAVLLLAATLVSPAGVWPAARESGPRIGANLQRIDP